MKKTDLMSRADAEMIAFEALPLKEKIVSLLADLLADTDSYEQFPVKHSFCNGMYMREMFIPKGSLLIGRVHKVECMNVCAMGDIDILTEFGGMRVTAGFTAISAAGTQKVGFANEDTIWVNIFRAEPGDIDELEKSLVYSDKEAFKLLDPDGKYLRMKELPCPQAG